jgi:branched-chain amino acid transport system permease protein
MKQKKSNIKFFNFLYNYFQYIFVFALFVWFTFFGKSYNLQICLGITISIILSIAWDIPARTGQASFGISAFFGLGAYLTAIFYPSLGLVGSWIISLIINILVAFVFGIIVLRLRGLYFAITTLAFSLTLQVLCIALEPITGGSSGISPYVIANGDRKSQFQILFIFLIISMLISDYFLKPIPKTKNSLVRSHPDLALSSGISVFKAKVITFGVSGGIASVAGAFYGGLYGYIVPTDVFNLNWNVNPLAIALLGGIDSTFGPIIGAIVLRMIEENTRTIFPSGGYHIIIGAVIILCITVMPKGIFGLLKKRDRTVT